MTEARGTARRRRRRATSAQGAPAEATPAPPAAGPSTAAEPLGNPGPASAPPDLKRKPDLKEKKARRPKAETGERGMHDVVGAGHSQLGISGALRGRDVNRPSDDDIADAERDVTIVRRHWTPSDGSPSRGH